MKVNKKFKFSKLANFSKNAIVVELSQDSLLAVEVANRNSGAELVRFVVRPLPQEGINSAWLRAVWHQEHLSQQRIVYCLPPALVKIKSILMPILPPAQLEAAAKIELESSNGSHQTGIVKVVGWQKQDQMLLVNVALVENDLFAKTLQIFKEAGLGVEWSGLRYQGLRNFINFNSGFFDESSEGTIYLDFDAEKTELGIIKDEALIFRRELGWGSHDLLNDQDPNAVPDFIEELRLSLAAYQAETKHKIPQKLGMFGKTEAGVSISRALNEELSLHLYTPEKTKLTGVLTHKYTPQLAPLIGLALDKTAVMRQEAIRIYTPEQDTARINKEKVVMAISIAMVICFVLGGIMLGLQANAVKNTQVNAWLGHKAALLTKLRRLEQQTVQNKNKIKQINNWLAGQNQELEFLLLLKNNLPDGAQITDLTIENGIIKDLSGLTPSASFLLNKFKKVPGLQNLKLKGTISTSLEGEIFQLEGAIDGKGPIK
jgi:hypothetical protein